jgi:hypothetical protein
VALLHYAPIDATLVGERLEIYPFLGSYLLAEAIDVAAPTWCTARPGGTEQIHAGRCSRAQHRTTGDRRRLQGTLGPDPTIPG